MDKYRYIYKITCITNDPEYKNKFYIGQHSTYNLNDGYCGSGVKINEYYNKYGKIEGKTFRKKIIRFYKSQKSLDKAEKRIINKYLYEPNCLNIVEGGLTYLDRKEYIHYDEPNTSNKYNVYESLEEAYIRVHNYINQLKEFERKNPNKLQKT